MIKELKEVPKAIKKISQRERIKQDITEAWDKGYKYFEFEPEGYNMKYLANYASDVAIDFISQMMADNIKAWAKEIGEPHYRWYMWHYPKDAKDKVIEIKKDKQNGVVYGIIHRERLSKNIEKAKKQIEVATEQAKERARKKIGNK